MEEKPEAVFHILNRLFAAIDYVRYEEEPTEGLVTSSLQKINDSSLICREVGSFDDALHIYIFSRK